MPLSCARAGAGAPRVQAKRRAARAGRLGEKAVKRRRMVGGVLKHIGTAAPGQQCTHCATQVRAAQPLCTSPACGIFYYMVYVWYIYIHKLSSVDNFHCR
jgi:hypothetical protein